MTKNIMQLKKMFIYILVVICCYACCVRHWYFKRL